MRRQIRLAQAEIMVRSAINPQYEAQLSKHFGGDGKVITADEVKAALGEDAAAAWINIRIARDEFLSIAARDEQSK